MDAGGSIDRRPARRAQTWALRRLQAVQYHERLPGGRFFRRQALPFGGGRRKLTDHLPAGEVKELIRYADSRYLEFGAPKKVFGESDKFAEQLAYEAQHNINDPLPGAAHGDVNTPLRCYWRCTVSWNKQEIS